MSKEAQHPARHDYQTTCLPDHKNGDGVIHLELIEVLQDTRAAASSCASGLVVFHWCGDALPLLLVVPVMSLLRSSLCIAHQHESEHGGLLTGGLMQQEHNRMLCVMKSSALHKG